MTTVYQIARDTVLAKDIVFGWVVIRDGELYLINAMELTPLTNLAELIPNNPIYEEVRKYIFNQIEVKKNEQLALKTQETLTQKVSSLLTQQEELWKKQQEKLQQERLESARHLVNTIRSWFDKNVPWRVYEICNDAGYVYARVVPCDKSFTLLSRSGEVVVMSQDLTEIVAAIFRRWG